jgi:copper(I)-binding protein
MRVFLTACVALLAASCGAPRVESPPAAAIVVTDAWAAPTPESVSVSAGYATLTNTQSEDDTLIAVESVRAARAEIHEMTMDDGVMRMRAAETLIIPAGGAVSLAPGGMHLMFYDVSAPFVAGESVDVRLRFARAGEVDVTLPVRARESGHGAHGGH